MHFPLTRSQQIDQSPCRKINSGPSSINFPWANMTCFECPVAGPKRAVSSASVSPKRASARRTESKTTDTVIKTRKFMTNKRGLVTRPSRPSSIKRFHAGGSPAPKQERKTFPRRSPPIFVQNQGMKSFGFDSSLPIIMRKKCQHLLTPLPWIQTS